MNQLEGQKSISLVLDMFSQSDPLNESLTDLRQRSVENLDQDYKEVNEVAADYLPYSIRPETYVAPVVCIIIFVVGLIGNGTLISIFIKHRSMRNVPNMYICSLAVGDILVIIFCIPFILTVYTFESWPFGTIICKFSEFIKDLSTGVSVFTLTALSVERYFAIIHPIRSRFQPRSSVNSCITIVCIWLAAILFALPSFLFSFVWTLPIGDTDKTYDVCYPFPEDLTERFAYSKVVVMFKFFIYYAIPLICISTCYILMAHYLLQSTRNVVSENQVEESRRIQSRKKVAKRVLFFVIIFAVCFLPSHIFLIWFYYYPDAKEHYNYFWHLVRMIGFFLYFINSCLSPPILYATSSSFREHFNSILFRCYREDDR